MIIRSTSFLSRARPAFWLLAALSVSGCSDEVGRYSDAPGATLWDHDWSTASTHAKLRESSPVPFPTDTALLKDIRYGEGGAPAVADVLEGVHFVFEIDGRMLAQPVGFERAETSGTSYRIVDEGFLRFSVEKSAWFRHAYSFDGSADSLLLSPADDGGGVLMGLVLQVVEMSLSGGELHSAAVRVASVLLSDPRVLGESDRFIYDLVHGALSDVPIQGTDDIVTWLNQLLRETGVVSDDMPETALDSELEPIVQELLSADSDGIADTLVEQILASGLDFEITPPRVEKVLRFGLYRSLLASRGYLSNVERVELVLTAED